MRDFMLYLNVILTISLIAMYILKNNKDKIPEKTKIVSQVDSDEFEKIEQDEKTITSKNVAGNEEAKESVSDIIDFMKNPKKYKKYGARMPKGILLYGPPGTGKTLMAKAIAGEIDAEFFAVSGSDFVQMYVGLGAKRVRELFKKAYECERAVIFIDEIDALGKKRNGELGSGNDERDQTLNALLTEMSGFLSKDNVLVIAATNRIDMLDEALLRPGRFDRQIEIGLPCVNARKSIINYYFNERPVSKDVNVDELAKQTVYFSGAMLENLINEASILAAKYEKENIGLEEFDKAYYTILAGNEKSDRSSIRQHDREITAYHEAGHALMTKILSPENSVSKVTIIPSTRGYGGFSLSIPPDKMYLSKTELENQIMISLAGRAAEEIIFGKDNITTGASNDINQASKIAKEYVGVYGMSDKVGLLNSDIFNNESDIKKECKLLIDLLYERSVYILEENFSCLEKIALNLLEYETLKEDELDKILSETLRRAHSVNVI